MQPERPKLPNEAIELYNSFIHGEIPRRDFLEGIKRFAIGGLATTGIIEALMPNYAQAQQVSKTDDRIKAAYMTVPSPEGNGNIKGYLVRPVSADTRTGKVEKLPGVIVVHENRGLNPHIEDITRRMALAGFMAFAPDALTSLGGFPGDDYAGGQMFQAKIDRGKMTEDMVAAANWLKSRDDCTGKIGATGFCFGGGMSNTLAVRLGADLAAAPFWWRSAAGTSQKSKARYWSTGELDKQLAATWRVRHGLEGRKRSTRRLHLPGAVHGFNSRRHARTLQKPRPIWPGSARLTGSTNRELSNIGPNSSLLPAHAPATIANLAAGSLDFQKSQERSHLRGFSGFFRIQIESPCRRRAASPAAADARSR
jgi:carboxymethylenebutenolidase